MAKAGKKAEPAGKVPVPIVLPKPTPVGKSAPAGKKAAAPPPPPPVPAKTTVRKGAVKVTVETQPAEAKVLPAVSPPAPPPAPAAPPPALTEVVRLAEGLKQTLTDAAAELATVRSEALVARSEVRALRAEREAIHNEMTDLLEAVRAAREAVGAARDEAAAGTEKARAAGAEAAAALDRVRAEAAAAVAPLADLKHLCRETGGALVKELGDQSQAVGKVRQMREQVDEVVALTTGSADRIKAFREECERAGQQAETLHLKAREAYLSSLAEVLTGLERVKAEAAAAHDRVATVPAPPPLPAVAAEPVASKVVSTTVVTTTDEGEAEDDEEDEDEDEIGDDPDEPAVPVGGGNRLGLTVTEGAVVAEVEEGSLAAELGLAPGDVIEAVDGSAVSTGAKLKAALGPTPDGRAATLRYRRGEDTDEVVARLGGGADEHLGVTVAGGVVVAAVDPGSPAAAAGIEPGDVIEAAAGQAVADGDELRGVILALPPGAEVKLATTRGGEAREVTAKLG